MCVLLKSEAFLVLECFPLGCINYTILDQQISHGGDVSQFSSQVLTVGYRQWVGRLGGIQTMAKNLADDLNNFPTFL